MAVAAPKRGRCDRLQTTAMTAIHFENSSKKLKLILLFHIATTEKKPKCKMEENSDVIANVGELNEPSLGWVIIAACL
jgi:hypothetical protein